MREIETEDAIVGVEDGRICIEIGRRTGERLKLDVSREQFKRQAWLDSR